MLPFIKQGEKKNYLAHLHMKNRNVMKTYYAVETLLRV